MTVELYNKVKKLVKLRYRGLPLDQKEDLVSVGYLAQLEANELEELTVARKAIHTHYNHKTPVVELPVSPEAQEALRAIKRGDTSEVPERLLAAFQVAYEPIEEAMDVSTDDTSESCEDKRVCELAMMCMTKKQWDYLYHIYYLGLTMDEVAVMYGVSKNSVKLVVTRALEGANKRLKKVLKE